MSRTKKGRKTLEKEVREARAGFETLKGYREYQEIGKKTKQGKFEGTISLELDSNENGLLAHIADNPYETREIEPLLDTLNETEREVIFLRYFKGLTQREVTRHLGRLTPVRISQIEKKAINKMKSKLGSRQEEEKRDVWKFPLEDGELILYHILTKSKDFLHKDNQYRGKLDRRKVRDFINSNYYGGVRVVDNRRISIYSARNYKARLNNLKTNYLFSKDSKRKAA